MNHPYHPLFGQEFQVADWRQNWTEDRVYFRGPNDVPTSIPSHWTDLAVEDPFVVVAAGRGASLSSHAVATASETVGETDPYPLHDFRCDFVFAEWQGGGALTFGIRT